MHNDFYVTSHFGNIKSFLLTKNGLYKDTAWVSKIICLNIIEIIFSTPVILCLKDSVVMFPKAVFVVFLNVEEEINKGSTVLR